MRERGQIVLISSYPPRLCGIATFCEEAREFIQKHNPDKEVLVISHIDGEGEGVIPIIDLTRKDWWKSVAQKIKEINPYAVHIEHEYGLYNYIDKNGKSDDNKGLIDLIDAISEFPIVVEPHTVHGRLRDSEAYFLRTLIGKIDVLMLKCRYQKWRLEWNFRGYSWEIPNNIMVVPHGARDDMRFPPSEVPEIKKEFGFDKLPNGGKHIAGLIGWIQPNKRWDIVASIWEEVFEEVYDRTGEKWTLLGAGAMRDPAHKKDYLDYKRMIKNLEKKEMAHYHEFVPRGEEYYKLMGVCDFIILPSTDETQSGTLARIFALNKPYITTAPMEGLTSQTLESEGGLLFTDKKMLKEKIIKLACDEALRFDLGNNLKEYLEEVVSWNIVAQQYNEAYKLASDWKRKKKKINIKSEF
ncbi:MAG: glycosyltransferase [Deltaproteobacteria bacterium]